MLRNGLNKEQYESSKDEFYTRIGMTEGLYTLEERDGETYIKYNMDSGLPEFGAATLNRFAPSLGTNKNIDRGYDRYVQDAVEKWDYYENTAALSVGVTNAVSVEDQQQITKIRANLDQFMARAVGPMIKGGGYDVWDDASWQQFCTDVKKYQADTVTQIYQKAIDALTQ